MEQKQDDIEQVIHELENREGMLKSQVSMVDRVSRSNVIDLRYVVLRPRFALVCGRLHALTPEPRRLFHSFIDTKPWEKLGQGRYMYAERERRGGSSPPWPFEKPCAVVQTSQERANDIFRVYR